VIVRAPATSANLGPAFDCAAVALGLWNELEVTEGDGVVVEGEGSGELPADGTNLAVRAYALFADPSGRRFRFTNRIPLERGLGSSAAAIALGSRPPGRTATRGSSQPGSDSRAMGQPAALAGGVTLTWEGRIARIAATLPLAPALVPASGRRRRIAPLAPGHPHPCRRGGERPPAPHSSARAWPRGRRPVRGRSRRPVATVPALRGLRPLARSFRRRRGRPSPIRVRP
jgi:hypothetical protein